MVVNSIYPVKAVSGVVVRYGGKGKHSIVPGLGLSLFLSASWSSPNPHFRWTQRLEWTRVGCLSPLRLVRFRKIPVGYAL